MSKHGTATANKKVELQRTPIEIEGHLELEKLLLEGLSYERVAGLHAGSFSFQERMLRSIIVVVPSKVC